MTALQFDAGQIHSVVPADAAVTGRFVQHALGFVEAPDLQQDPCPVPPNAAARRIPAQRFIGIAQSLVEPFVVFQDVDQECGAFVRRR